MIILDGGMGRELKRMGAPFDQPEWSALALMNDPAIVEQAHRNFIDAGAEVITVNAYAVVPFHIGDERFALRGRELAALAGRLARQAADSATHPPLVAASVPPLFGSYEPDAFRPEDAPAMYEVIVDAQAPFVDLWLVETMSSIEESRAAITAIESHRHESDQPIWLAFCLPDTEPEGPVRLRSGETIAELVEVLHHRVAGFLVNCSMPERIDEALPELRSALDAVGSVAAIGAYANSFSYRVAGVAANAGYAAERSDLTPDVYAEVADGWAELGASIIGGCCGIHPEHIAEIARHHRPTGVSPNSRRPA